MDELFQTVSLTARILTAAREVEKAMRDSNSPTLLGALNDVKGQLAGLVFPGFVSRTGTARLHTSARYLARGSSTACARWPTIPVATGSG